MKASGFRQWRSMMLLVALLIGGRAGGAAFDPPVIRPVPDAVRGIAAPVVDLGGEWEISMDGGEWRPVAVPGEPSMQGFPVEYDRPFTYRKRIAVPPDFRGARTLLRFHGVYGHARVFIDGKPVREHRGGFTAWDCDLTDLVVPGREAELRLEVTDEGDDISKASKYAKHRIGGILRRVELYAVPTCHLQRLYLDAELDDSFADGVLRVRAKLDVPVRRAELTAVLTAGDGKAVATETYMIAENWLDERITVKSVLPWDAEHPNLYALSLVLREDGRGAAEWRRRVGFRTVKVDGDLLLVNGKPVKLRGACRHDVHPTLGRTATPELDRLDARLLKRANLNFVRTSHYPASTDFIRACDEIGIYVLEEAAVCFNRQMGKGKVSWNLPQDRPEFRDRFLSQYAEMVESHRNHPSIIMWSLGNESYWGDNITACARYSKRVDPARPLMFSYPRTMPHELKLIDVLSSHYPPDGRVNVSKGWAGHTKARGRNPLPKVAPILHDEWLHVACYCKELIKSDPNIRCYWGLGMKRMWDATLKEERALGGAIWGFVDDVFHLPDGRVVGWGPWGIIDVWRREKPEYHETRKAHSPVRLTGVVVARPEKGASLAIPVENRFDHTFLNELTVRYRAGGAEGILPAPATAPHATGVLTVPALDWTACEGVALSLVDPSGNEVDDVLVRFSADPPVVDASPPGGINVREGADAFTAAVSDAAMVFDKKTGFIRSLVLGGKEQLVAPVSPVLMSTVPRKGKVATFSSLSKWIPTGVSLETRGGVREVVTEGSFRNGPAMGIRYALRSDGIDVSYRLLGLSESGGKPADADLGTIGVAVPLGAGIDTIRWRRSGLWTTYPDDHIGRLEGSACRRPEHPDVVYGRRPEWPYSRDRHDFYLLGKGSHPATKDFLSTRMDIETFSVATGAEQSRLAVVRNAAARTHCRMTVAADGTVTLLALNLVDYRLLGRPWGNYCEPSHRMSRPFEGAVSLRFLAR